MKIALCSKGNFSLEKGFTKNRIELAECLEKLGWETVLVDKEKLNIPAAEKYNAKKHSYALKEYLLENYDVFDVVLYEYDTLPFDRNIFNKSTLFIARPAILAYHFPEIEFRYDLRTKISRYLKKWRDKLNGKTNDTKELFRKLDYSLAQADLIQVQNKKDKQLLAERGFSAENIIIVPNGIMAERISKFGDSLSDLQKPFCLAFVGTFDFRKGAMDFLYLFKKLKIQFPDLKLKLLGTRGLFFTEKQVLDFFPRKYRSSIKVIPNFKSDELPELLSDCQLGVFPSYLESFGFGALEMMCAGLPVVAYDCPGPSDFILPDLLVPTGNREQMLQKILYLLQNEQVLLKKSKEARETIVSNYKWEDIAKKVDTCYRSRVKSSKLAAFNFASN